VLHRVAGENVTERRGDDAAHAVVVERVDRRFARGAAAVIARADDQVGVAPGRTIEREVRPLVAVLVEAQVVEQHLADAHGARPLEIARWDDLIGVEVDLVDRAGGRGEPGKLLHSLKPFVPRSAAARRRGGLRPPPPPPWPATSGACARAAPG